MMRLPQYAIAGCCAVACLFVAVVAAAEARMSMPNHDDFHYPPEEQSEFLEMKSQMPTLKAINATTATLVFPSGDEVAARAPSLIKNNWHVVAILDSSAPAVVLEREFSRWGYLAVLGLSSSVTMRKSVGALAGIRQPYYNFTAADPDYWQKVSSGLTDYAATLAEAASADGELNYTGLANTIAPQRDIVSISNKQDVVKFAVTHAGRVKCAYRENTGDLTEGGITELQNQHSPAPNPQTIVFDPANHLDFWPERFEDTKTGMLGGWLSVANVGSFSRTQNKGFELIAFGPNKPPATQLASAPCQYTGSINDTYLAGYPAGSGSHAVYHTLAEAEAACDQVPGCNGITLRKGSYELRAGAVALPSPTGETSWLMTNASKADCRSLPRVPGVVYNPGVYVRLRAQNGPVWGAEDQIQYFYVDNSTRASSPRTVSAIEFYTALAGKAGAQRTRMSSGMSISLPGAEGQRQLDMSLAGMLGASNNYIGEQSNYGYGGTYWSYGREDNGSLPLNVLTVDSALLEWGLFDEAAAHMSFYFDNYVRPDGTIDFYSWGARGDSVGDIGRLIEIYAQIMRVGKVVNPSGASQFDSRYWHVAEAFGNHLLRILTAQAKVSPPPGAAGLLQGPPEHDWWSTQDKYFYNNNVWTLRGLDVLADLVAARPGGNKTFLAELQTAAQSLRTAITQSVEECKINDATGKLTFLPPYAQKNTTPYKSMTDTREASYSNFRFWSETLLADVLPRDAEAAWLDYHNNKGGRVGGASRWSTHLDDMPVAGWGYGALSHNRTQDFNALLYGHMATYQSRGSFHATEQLSYLGEGLYRSFLHWKDPLPNPNSTVQGKSPPVEAAAAGELGGYYSAEQDISFCIVTEVLAARLTRWQLVFEDFYRPAYGSTSEAVAIWLGRGAPLRWFAPAEGDHKAGFNVTCAPTRVGCVSYNVTIQGPTQATYSVRIHDAPADAPQGVVFKMRWPANVVSPAVKGAKVIAVDEGVVAVLPDETGVFSVSASYTR